jgi:hypothetical protein
MLPSRLFWVNIPFEEHQAGDVAFLSMKKEK